MNLMIHVNGKREALMATTVSELLRSKDIPPDNRGVAVAVNGKMLPRSRWTETRLADGDAVEIVKAFVGG